MSEIRICSACGHPESRHPVVQILDTEFGDIPSLVCGHFVDGGTLDDVWNSRLRPTAPAEEPPR